MLIVAVTLLSMTALLSLLAWGLIRMVIKSRGTLVIDSKAVAILFKLGFHVEYRCPDQSALHPETYDQVVSGEPAVNPRSSASGEGAELQGEGGDDVK
jgi:hypothetical protein